MKQTFVPSLLSLAVALLIAGCNREANPFENPAATAPVTASPGLAPSASAPLTRVEQPSRTVSGAELWDKAMSWLGQAYQQAEQLHAAVNALLAAPSPQNLELAQQQWLKAAAAYERFYIFTRLGLVQPKSHLALLDHHGNLAAWPVQPGFLDAFGEYPRSGIVFDVDLPITEVQLRRQHGLTDASDVALGLYALHFGLFGEVGVRDLSSLTESPELTQLQRDEGYIHAKELPNNRRRELLRLQTELLKADLTQMGLAWQASRTALVNMPQDEWQAAMVKAALTMVTEQMLALSEHNQSAEGPDASLTWQNRQLAQRLVSQLRGWQQVLAAWEEAESAQFAPLTQEALTQLAAWQEQPEPGDAPRPVHQALRNLAGALQAQVENL